MAVTCSCFNENIRGSRWYDEFVPHFASHAFNCCDFHNVGHQIKKINLRKDANKTDRVLIYANCTSPASDQILLAASLEEQLADAAEVYDEIFPFTLCPPALFFNIIRISHMRGEASSRLIQGDSIENIFPKALDLLTEIEAFSAQDWAQPGPYLEEWLTIASAYKHTTALYCIISLQSLGVLPVNQHFDERRAYHADLLSTHVRQAMLSRRLKRFVTISVLALGVEAAYKGEGRRKWVQDTLVELSQCLGTGAPLKVKTLLREYWDRGVYGWEEFFNQPYAFMFG